MKVWHERFLNRAFNVSRTCNGTALWKGVCLQHKVIFHNHGFSKYCAAHLSGAFTQVGKEVGTQSSHLLPVSWPLIFVLLAFPFCHCNTVKSCSVAHCLQCLVFSTTDIWRLDLHGKWIWALQGSQKTWALVSSLLVTSQGTFLAFLTDLFVLAFTWVIYRIITYTQGYMQTTL